MLPYIVAVAINGLRDVVMVCFVLPIRSMYLMVNRYKSLLDMPLDHYQLDCKGACCLIVAGLASS